jgi:transposase
LGMKAYSLDLRSRVLAAVEVGAPLVSVAERFQVGEATVRRWVRLHEATGSLAPRPRRGRRPHLGFDDVAALDAQVAAAPDATLVEHCTRWAETHGRRPSRSAMGRALQRRDWRRKKRPSTPANKIP